jgi:glycosyltransferase involved in cell wall biosynthesis
VIPNYYDVADWKPVEKHGDYLLYFGRIQEDKGLLIVREIAERQGIPVKIVGMGDPRPYMGDNVTSGPPITGADAKNALLGGARAILMPTRYVEPFGGSGVEAMLCGTPVISSDFGAFTETVEHGKTGFRCHTLGDYLAAIEAIPSLDRKYIAERARTLYSLETVGKKYDSVFQQIVDLGDAGWFTERSYTIGG